MLYQVHFILSNQFHPHFLNIINEGYLVSASVFSTKIMKLFDTFSDHVIIIYFLMCCKVFHTEGLGQLIIVHVHVKFNKLSLNGMENWGASELKFVLITGNIIL